MPLGPEDLAVINAERDASPDRFARSRQVTLVGARSSDDSDAESVELQEIASHNQARPSLNQSATATDGYSTLSRSQSETDRFNRHERHPGALHRIETHRTQHTHTIGGGLSRRTTGATSKPLPSFGAGKPYPPALPDKEEYVVEFDGHDVGRVRADLAGASLADMAMRRIPCIRRTGRPRRSSTLAPFSPSTHSPPPWAAASSPVRLAS